MPTFEQRDPTAPGFWSERFEQNFTPWDQGGVPKALHQYVTANPQMRHALIPGCGSAYELVFLSEAGWDVVAIDFSPAAVAAARNNAGRWHGRVVEADFFSFVPTARINFIYERAFLCALPSALRPQIVQRWTELLAPGGVLAGFFYFDESPKGPPFGIVPTELDALLAPYFEKVDDCAVDDSIAVMAGKERWQVWRRISSRAA